MRSTETALRPSLRRAALVLLAGARAIVVRAQEVVIPGIDGSMIGGEVPMFIPVEMPGPGFPGATAAESNAAWPSGRQPFNKGAWPQTGFRTKHRVLASCWKKTILHDHERGWPGLCLKLWHTNITEERKCREVCAAESRCPVWQFVNQTDPDECWLGFGEECLTRGGQHDDITVQGAQRIMHGEVRVLMNLTGWKINHLTNIGVYSPSDEALNVLRCKAWCYSTLLCQYWQYGPTGCWVDNPLGHRGDPSKKVQYPLTISPDGAEQYTEEAVTMRYGEYIQHYCPPPDHTSTMAPLSSDIHLGSSHEGGTGAPFPPPWLLGLLVLGLISCLVAYLFHAKAAASSNGSSRVKKSRGMRMADNGFDYDEPEYDTNGYEMSGREVSGPSREAYDRVDAQEAQTQLLGDGYSEPMARTGMPPSTQPVVFAGSTFDMPRGDSSGHARVPSGPFNSALPGPPPPPSYRQQWHAAPPSYPPPPGSYSMPSFPPRVNY